MPSRHCMDLRDEKHSDFLDVYQEDNRRLDRELGARFEELCDKEEELMKLLIFPDTKEKLIANDNELHSIIDRMQAQRKVGDEIFSDKMGSKSWGIAYEDAIRRRDDWEESVSGH
ncbi:hypothetical protein H072_6009 [Dactylellina haptotyla CBS 200.50]|uniref:Uncharacterized protein n=1 Tax=Dactylellina haptotyla (strain CBS 200.50) TaxID=1284197 RepID=S8AG85_DACHA|nr:hypothetical protein H072_6009 [Dactylellina haptotyla CBS 200.50]